MAKGGRGRPKVENDKGPLQARARNARAFLSVADRIRLELLVNVPAEKILERGEIELPAIKRPRTPTEEREALFKAVRDEAEGLLNKAKYAPHAAERRDPIGRAWFAGLLDGHGVDGAVLRELGREYGDLYWMDVQSLSVASCGYDERVGKPNVRAKFRMAELTGKDAARFAHFDNVLTNTGHHIRRAVQALCVDDIWFSEGPAWLDRCIASRATAKADIPRIGGPRMSDTNTLRLAIKGLKALAHGTIPLRGEDA